MIRFRQKEEKSKYRKYVKYNNFSISLIDKLRSDLEKQRLSILGYTDKSIARRISQCVQHKIYEKIMSYANSQDNNQNTIPDTIITKDIIYNPSSIKITLTKRFKILSLFKFIFMWGYLFFFYMSKFFHMKGNGISSNILIGVNYQSIFNNNTDKQFIDFCNNGHIQQINNDQITYVELGCRKKTSKTCKSKIYCKRAILQVFLDSQTSFTKLILLLFNHIKIFTKYFFYVLKNPLFFLLSKDLALHPLMKYMDDNLLIKEIFTTAACYQDQPLWLADLPNKHYRSNMLWYSIFHTAAYKFADDIVLSQINTVSADIHWCWNYEHKIKIQKSIKNSKCIIKKPLIFWHIDKNTQPFSSKKQIVIFDITPMNFKDDELPSSYILGNYIVTLENMMSYIDKIIKSVTQVTDNTGHKIDLLLKPKRYHHRYSSQEYNDFLLKQQDANRCFKLIDYHANTFQLLRESMLSISFPFTSTAYVSSYIETPACYFDPTGCIYKERIDASIKFISKQQALISYIESILL